MSRGVWALLLAQFLSAFSDNAILFTVIAIVLQDAQTPGWYIPALQAVFLVAYVVLAPWAGAWADQYPKPHVLIAANLLKAVGAGMILLHIEPLLAYAIVGAGAAVYSPAKYGILPELVRHDQLVQANSWIEGSTITAIVLGTVVGAQMADLSVQSALFMVVCIYLISAVATLAIPGLSAKGRQPDAEPVIRQFYVNTRHFLQSPRARFVLLGSSLFWATAATLRVILVAWAPMVLHMKQASDIADLTLFLSFGIIAGSVIVPRLIPLEQLPRTRFAAYAMAAMIIALGLVDAVWPARCVMFVIGCSGGLLIVPLNAALQEMGHQSIGGGDAVAMQNFLANIAMLCGVGAYGFAASQGGEPVASLIVLGGLVWSASFMVARKVSK